MKSALDVCVDGVHDTEHHQMPSAWFEARPMDLNLDPAKTIAVTRFVFSSLD